MVSPQTLDLHHLSCHCSRLPCIDTGYPPRFPTFLHVWLKRTSLVLLNEDICKTSPNSEMRDIGFPLEPGFVRSHAFERGRRKVVPDVDLSCKCFPPKRWW